jgi:hypothetical protein
MIRIVCFKFNMAGHLQKLQYYLKNMTIIAILKMKYNLYIINIIVFLQMHHSMIRIVCFNTIYNKGDYFISGNVHMGGILA